MFKKFTIAFMAALMVATPAMAGKFGGGSSFSSSKSFSSGSSFRSSSFSSSSYRPTTTYRSTPSYTSTRTAPASPRFSSGPSYNTSRPAQSTVVSRPTATYGRTYGGNTYNNYNSGGGFGSSFGGAFTGSILGNMIMGGGYHQPPVYVNTGGAYGAPGGYVGGAYDSGFGFFSMIFWGFVNLLTLIFFVAVIVWIIRKFIFRK